MQKICRTEILYQLNNSFSLFPQPITHKSPSLCRGPQFACWHLPSALSQAVQFPLSLHSQLVLSLLVNQKWVLRASQVFLSKHTSLAVYTVLWEHTAFKNPRTVWKLSVCYRYLIPQVFFLSLWLTNFYPNSMYCLWQSWCSNSCLWLFFSKCLWGLFVLDECWVRSNIDGFASGDLPGNQQTEYMIILWGLVFEGDPVLTCHSSYCPAPVFPISGCCFSRL